MRLSFLAVAAICIFCASLWAQNPAGGRRVYGRVAPAETQTVGAAVPGIPDTAPAARGNTVRLSGKTLSGAGIDMRVLIAPDGTFEFLDVAPGTYELIVSPSSIPPMSVEVGNADLPEVRLGAAMARVAGTVVVEGGGPAPRFQLEWTTANTNDARRVALFNAASSFSSEILSGTFRVTPAGLPDGFSLRSIVSGALDLTKQPIALRSGETAKIVVTLGVASPSPFHRVSGRVSPAPGPKPRAIRLSGSSASEPITAAVNPDGSFDFPKVLPGEYTAYALPAVIHLATAIRVNTADIKDVVIAAPTVQQLVGEFVKVAPGEFMMGCSPGDAQCEAIELPPHRVGITRPFEIGKYEVTQTQWEAVMGTNPSQFKGEDRPVEGFATWVDTQEFIERLNLLGDGYRYRLPTEAEWEYAARAGTTGPVPAELSTIGWTSIGGAADSQTHPVGQKQPNAWGIFDMIGNAQEWVQDFFSPSYYAESPVLDPKGPAVGVDHVVRGGAWSHIPQWSRVSFRRNLVNRGSYGFRLVREEIAP